MRETKTTNPQLIELINHLHKQSSEQNVEIWTDVADYLSKTRTKRVVVNLSSINRNTKKGDVVIVPGKILASGKLNHALTIAAFEISTAAAVKLEAVKAKFISIEELLVKNPKGSNVKIIR